MSDNIVNITTDTIFDQEVIFSGHPVLVDFWAEWCPPCKMIAPILDEIANEYAGRLKICKIDTDSLSSIAERFSVRGIPTLILFKDGNVLDTKVGALSKKQLTEFIDAHL